jgi:hypothetical protein
MNKTYVNQNKTKEGSAMVKMKLLNHKKTQYEPNHEARQHAYAVLRYRAK